MASGRPPRVVGAPATAHGKAVACSALLFPAVGVWVKPWREDAHGNRRNTSLAVRNLWRIAALDLGLRVLPFQSAARFHASNRDNAHERLFDTGVVAGGEGLFQQILLRHQIVPKPIIGQDGCIWRREITRGKLRFQSSQHDRFDVSEAHLVLLGQLPIDNQRPNADLP